MFKAVLFTIAKIWKQFKCPSTEGQIKKMWCVSTHRHTQTHTHTKTHTQTHTDTRTHTHASWPPPHPRRPTTTARLGAARVVCVTALFISDCASCGPRVLSLPVAGTLGTQGSGLVCRPVARAAPCGDQAVFDTLGCCLGLLIELSEGLLFTQHRELLSWPSASQAPPLGPLECRVLFAKPLILSALL